MKERIVSNWLVDKLLRKPYDGFTAWCIFVRPAWRWNTPLLEHERLHRRRQQEMGTIRWWWKYLRDADFRLAEEVLAYKRQLEVGEGPLTKEKAAKYLQTYKPGLTYVDALRLLL